MISTIPTPIIHVYNEINSGKFSSVRHFELEDVAHGAPILTSRINISQDRKFARSNPEFWLKIREHTKWSTPITGLFKSSEQNVFFGDSSKKSNLIIAVFKDNYKKLVIYYYKNYYPQNIDSLIGQTVR